jgi:hypothetical protein
VNQGGTGKLAVCSRTPAGQRYRFDVQLDIGLSRNEGLAAFGVGLYIKSVGNACRVDGTIFPGPERLGRAAPW